MDNLRHILILEHSYLLMRLCILKVDMVLHIPQRLTLYRCSLLDFL
jgi:hypothetical protein